MKKNWAVSAMAIALLLSCTAAGPRPSEIVGADGAVVVERTAGSDVTSKFAVIEADRNVAFMWRQYEATRAAFFKDSGQGRVTIQSGDVLSISLVSFDDLGYVDYTTNAIAPLATTTLPVQQVTEMGTINVPPLGRVRVAGRTVPDLEAYLDERLGDVLVDPSVVVEIAQRNGALVSLVGNVREPGAYPYTRGDTRILDLVNLAGGASSDIEGLEVMVSRQGEVRSVPLADMYMSSGLNIHVRPGDVISVAPRNNSVVVLGATGSNEELLFDSPTISLSNVLGKIGGIENRRADPAGVFLYRATPRTLADFLGVDSRALPGDDILAIYRFDLTQPDAFFTVKEFDVRDGDLIYVANSAYEEIDAALDVFTNAILRPAQAARIVDDL